MEKVEHASQLKRGTQIVYRAPGGDKIEEGFVTSVEPEQGVAWCRYWLPDYTLTLRTRSRSEMTPIDRLWIQDTRDQDIVEMLLESLTPAPCDNCNRDCRTAFPACIRENVT